MKKLLSIMNIVFLMFMCVAPFIYLLIVITSYTYGFNAEYSMYERVISMVGMSMMLIMANILIGVVLYGDEIHKYMSMRKKGIK